MFYIVSSASRGEKTLGPSHCLGSCRCYGHNMSGLDYNTLAAAISKNHDISHHGLGCGKHWQQSSAKTSMIEVTSLAVAAISSAGA